MLRATGGDAPVTTGNYIDGVARPAEGGRTYALYNPARPDELVGHAALSPPLTSMQRCVPRMPPIPHGREQAMLSAPQS